MTHKITLNMDMQGIYINQLYSSHLLEAVVYEGNLFHPVHILYVPGEQQERTNL